MEARNRRLGDWLKKVETGEILLPRFQRHEAWGHRDVASLLESVLRGLPTGALLTLEIGDKQPFIARPLTGITHPTERVTEHLLDGQQRLTALWRALNDDYDDRTFFVAAGGAEEDEPGIAVQSQSMSSRKGQVYPLWARNPAECWRRGLVPIRLCRPGDLAEEVKGWATSAAGEDGDAWSIAEFVNKYREAFSAFNIPFLSLPAATPKEVALEVFIKMNTSSVRLTAFDVMVAQFEAATGESLHDIVDSIEYQVPGLPRYRRAQDLILDVAALRENRPPNQVSYQKLDLSHLWDESDQISRGVDFATTTLEAEAVFDADRLPTIAVIPVLAALNEHIPAGGDERGNALALVRAYLWRAFSTSRYESAAASAALQDLRGLIEELNGGSDRAPIFDEDLFPLPDAPELIRAGWPKNRQTLARAVLCASLHRGALDLADGERASVSNMKAREYHHLFPVAYLGSADDLAGHNVYAALNCSLISWTTNRKIGAKPPLEYLRDRINNSSLGEEEIRRRLESHLVPWEQLSAVSKDVSKDYSNFLEARAEMVVSYLGQLCNGLNPSK